MPSPEEQIDTIGVGVIGCGWIAELVHLPNLRRRRDVVVAAVADERDARRAVAQGWFPDAVHYRAAGDVVADPRVQAILLATPPAANPAILRTAFAAGKSAYVEKPMAASAADGASIVAAWRPSGAVAMIGYNFRFNPIVEDAVRQVRSGALGEVVSVQSRFTWAAHSVDDWRADPARGGGVLLDLASHHLDLFSLIAGSRITQVAASERAVLRAADTVDVTARAGGSVLHLHASLAGGANANRLAIFGTKAQLEVDLLAPRPARAVAGGGGRGRSSQFRRAAEALHPAGMLRRPGYEPSFGRALDVFLQAVRARSQPEPSPDTGLCVLHVVAAARRSIARGGAPATVEAAALLEGLAS